MSIDLLAAKAARVADMHRRNREAMAELRASQLALARAIVEAVRPALKALSNPVTVLHHDTKETFPVRGLRGVRLAVRVEHHGSFAHADGGYDPAPPLQHADEVRVHGRGIFLTEDGTFATTTLIESAGPRFHVEWQREELEQIAEWFDPESLVADMTYALNQALDQQLSGKLAKRTTQLQETASDLRAIARLASRKGA